MDELRAALAAPDAFVEQLLNEAVGPAAIAIAIARLRPVLEPKLPSPLAWSDIEPGLALVDTVDELRVALAAPDAFLNKLLDEAVGPAAITIAIARLRPVLEPKLPSPLAWSDIEPGLALVDTVDELRVALAAPDAFLNKLLDEGVGPAAITIAIARLRPYLEPKLPSPLTWTDVEPALALIDTVDELRHAVRAPATFLRRLLDEAVGPAAMAVVAVRMRRVLEPMLPSPLEWRDVQSMIRHVNTIEKMRAVINNPNMVLKAFSANEETALASGKAAKETSMRYHERSDGASVVPIYQQLPDLDESQMEEMKRLEDTLGTRWKFAGTDRPTMGQEIINERLSRALLEETVEGQNMVEFTPAQLRRASTGPQIVLTQNAFTALLMT